MPLRGRCNRLLLGRACTAEEDGTLRTQRRRTKTNPDGPRLTRFHGAAWRQIVERRGEPRCRCRCFQRSRTGNAQGLSWSMAACWAARCLQGGREGLREWRRDGSWGRGVAGRRLGTSFGLCFQRPGLPSGVVTCGLRRARRPCGRLLLGR